MEDFELAQERVVYIKVITNSKNKRAVGIKQRKYRRLCRT